MSGKFSSKIGEVIGWGWRVEDLLDYRREVVKRADRVEFWVRGVAQNATGGGEEEGLLDGLKRYALGIELKSQGAVITAGAVRSVGPFKVEGEKRLDVLIVGGAHNVLPSVSMDSRVN
jgi:hypothetical protein